MSSSLPSPTPSPLDVDRIPSPVPSISASLLQIDPSSSSELPPKTLAAYTDIIADFSSRSYSAPEDLEALETDLKLSAEIGQALLAEQKVLQARFAASDLAKDQLLDRLAKSYKDNAQLEKVKYWFNPPPPPLHRKES
jgi:hypothetical protein